MVGKTSLARVGVLKKNCMKVPTQWASQHRASRGTASHIRWIVCGEEDSTNFIADRLGYLVWFLVLDSQCWGSKDVITLVERLWTLNRTNNICSIQESDAGEDIGDVGAIEVQRVRSVRVWG